MSTVTPLSPLYNDTQVHGTLPPNAVNQYDAMARRDRACPQYDICYPRVTTRLCRVGQGHDHQLPRLLYYSIQRNKRLPVGFGEWGAVKDAPQFPETIVEQQIMNPSEDARIALATARRLADAMGRRAYVVGSFGAKPSRDPRYFVPVVYVQPGGLVRLIDHRPVGTVTVNKMTPFEFQYYIAMGNGTNLLPRDA